MSFKMKPTSQIKIDLGLVKGGDVLAFATNECYRRMDKYVPYDTGNLAYDSVDVDTQNGIIKYQAEPYAIIQYMGGNWENRPSAGHEYAGPYWDKRMWSAEGQDVINAIQDYIRSKK